MLKTNKILYLVSFVFLGFISSCDDYLDTVPDQRTEINSTKKVKDLLISAYPTLLPWMVYEMGTDNYTDVGERYSLPSNTMIRAYRWQDIGETDWDTPQEIWDACYKAIATANQALEAIDNMGTPDACLPYKGEALLCRAYGHFVLANTFCMPYSKKDAEQQLGIPYITAPETDVNVQYSRGTMEDVYTQLNKDIEEALPLIDDDAYDVPLYHFNHRAAYAFAAQFNLFYGNYRKSADYATTVLGQSPASSLRNMTPYAQLTTPDDWTVAFLKSTERCNIMLIANRSIWGRNYNREYRYGHNRSIATSQTIWSKGPWKGTTAGALSVYSTVFGTDRVLYVPKCQEMFEVTNQSANTGQPHVTAFAFTTDETLITRAEAYSLLGDFDKAAEDLSTWYTSKGSSVTCSASAINSFYSQADTTTVAKPLHPKFAITAGRQTNMIQACLHARRIESIHEGKRWLDIRRYGIALQHPLSSGDTLRLSSGDKRYAIQIPNEVTLSGLEKNPR